MLASGRGYGRADILARVDTPSALGAFSYEVHHTKLARDARASALLQLAAYSDLLAIAQGLERRRPRAICSSTSKVTRSRVRAVTSFCWGSSHRACTVVASARLLDVECRTPAQMRLVNAFCRYRELARRIDLG